MLLWAIKTHKQNKSLLLWAHQAENPLCTKCTNGYKNWPGYSKTIHLEYSDRKNSNIMLTCQHQREHNYKQNINISWQWKDTCSQSPHSERISSTLCCERLTPAAVSSVVFNLFTASDKALGNETPVYQMWNSVGFIPHSGVIQTLTDSTIQRRGKFSLVFIWYARITQLFLRVTYISVPSGTQKHFCTF